MTTFQKFVRLTVFAVAVFAVGKVLAQVPAPVDLGSGTLTYSEAQGTVKAGRFTGVDANTFTTPESNLMSLLDNSGGNPADTTCATRGAADTLTIIDSTNAASDTDTWDLCVGTAPSAFRAHGAHVYASGLDSTCANTTYCAVPMNQERYDSDGYHDNVTNNSRITIPTGMGGTYLMTCSLRYGVNAACVDTNTPATCCSGSGTGACEVNSRIVAIRVDGTTIVAQSTPLTSDFGGIAVYTLSTQYRVAAGSYVECVGWHDTADQNWFDEIVNESPEFRVTLLGS